MADFDERSGVVSCQCPWGRWWQTMDDVQLEINVPQGTRAKDIQCDFTPTKLHVSVKGQVIIDGVLPSKIHQDESLWTLEDQHTLRVFLLKTSKSADNCWKSLLQGQYEVDPFTFDKMEQKMTLQRFQYENPGMDFSGANISGNYQGGGPKVSS